MRRPGLDANRDTLDRPLFNGSAVGEGCGDRQSEYYARCEPDSPIHALSDLERRSAGTSWPH